MSYWIGALAEGVCDAIIGESSGRVELTTRTSLDRTPSTQSKNTKPA